MAFVFRSQKQSPFKFKIDKFEPSQLTSLNNQQSQLNGTTYSNIPTNQPPVSPSKVLKGLPSLLRKDRSIKSDNLKENDIFQEGANFQNVKNNLKQMKKVTSNYFFTSNVSRDINKDSSKLLDKSLTCSQFNASTNDELSILEQKKPFMTNYLSNNFAVNKNLASLQQRAIDFRKSQTEAIQRNKLPSKLLIDCSKQENSQIKRKSSPPRSIDRIPFSSNFQKTKFPKEKSQQQACYDQGAIYMKTMQMMKPLKKCHTQKKLSKLHKGNMQSSFYKESDSEHSDSQYEEENITPGPGTYDNTINLKQMKSFRSRKEKFAKIFVSPLERFKQDEVKYHEITYVNEQYPPKQQKVRNNHVFLSSTPKFIPIEKKSLSPEPGTYNPRESLEHDIVRNLLRNANIASFNSTLPRFKDTKTKLTPGPGEYDIDSLEKAKQQETKSHLSSSYKSQVQRCLDYVKEESSKEGQETCSIQGLIDRKHKNHVIHKREQHFDSSEFYSPPPFYSGVERFKTVSQDDSSPPISPTLNSKYASKETKNTQPFNSSEERKLSQKVGQGVGVGSYLTDKDGWNKKSYNIFFH